MENRLDIVSSNDLIGKLVVLSFRHLDTLRYVDRFADEIMRADTFQTVPHGRFTSILSLLGHSLIFGLFVVFVLFVFVSNAYVTNRMISLPMKSFDQTHSK